MKYLGERPKSSYHGGLTRDKYLYESKVAGVGATGPNRDLFQERLELTGIAGTTYEPYQRHNHHRCPRLFIRFNFVLNSHSVGNVGTHYIMTSSFIPQDPALHN